MIVPRETIISAMLARLSALTSFQTISRQWNSFDTAATLEQLPALFLIDTPEKHMKQGRRMPAKIDLTFDLVLVVPNPPDGTPGAAINPLLDQMDAIWMPTIAERYSGSRLDGLVEEVWVEGTVQKNYSFLGGRASIAVVPLHARSTNPQ